VIIFCVVGFVILSGLCLQFFLQNYTLHYRVSDGFYSVNTRVLIYLTSANMYPPRFSRPRYTRSDITENDQSAVGRLITTVSHTHLFVCHWFGSVSFSAN